MAYCAGKYRTHIMYLISTIIAHTLPGTQQCTMKTAQWTVSKHSFQLYMAHYNTNSKPKTEHVACTFVGHQRQSVAGKFLSQNEGKESEWQIRNT